jgi:hypothetical protein
VYQLLKERDAQVAEQQVRIEGLEARLMVLEAALTADERPARSLFRDPAAGWLVLGNVFLFGAVLLHRTRRDVQRQSGQARLR